MPMKNGRMLYKYPGKMLKHNSGSYDYLIVEHEDADEHVKQGWSITIEDAVLAHEKRNVEATSEDEIDSDSPPTRAELEEQCKKLGIKVDGRYSDARLAKLIAEKMG